MKSQKFNSIIFPLNALQGFLLVQGCFPPPPCHFLVFRKWTHLVSKCRKVQGLEVKTKKKGQHCLYVIAGVKSSQLFTQPWAKCSALPTGRSAGSKHGRREAIRDQNARQPTSTCRSRRGAARRSAGGPPPWGVQPASSQEFTFRARPRTLFFPVTFDELPTESLLNLNLQDSAGRTVPRAGG